jgi:hypothetical protein
MRPSLIRAICFVAMSLCLSACDDQPAGPTGPDITGTWTGTLNDSLAGVGTVRLTIIQSGSRLSGTWASTFQDPTFSNSGTLTGTYSGTSATITLTPGGQGACPFRVTATPTATAITGTYAAVNCQIAIGGSVTVTKE